MANTESFLDPKLIAEVHALTMDARPVLQIIATLAERVGKVMEQMDDLEIAVELDDERFNEICRVVGWTDLLAIMHTVACHALAAADEVGFHDEPSWYADILAQRLGRIEVA